MDKDAEIRLALLEKEVQLRFKEMEKALVLARDLVTSDTRAAADIINQKLIHMNEVYTQMREQRATFATKTEFRSVERLVFIGAGIVVAFEILIRFIKA